MRVAVVGGGIFGCTTAVELSMRGHQVTLFEKSAQLMGGASRTNQLRLHRGYHYPRSPETVRLLQESLASFLRVYGKCTYSCPEHLYCIARSGSLTTPQDFLRFCDDHDLPYRRLNQHPALNMDAVSLVVKCQEKMINYTSLVKQVRMDTKESGVQVRLGTQFTVSDVDQYDLTVNATYASLNELLTEEERSEYQFELCEKIVVSPPKHLQNLSVVVMDGPFCCLDPIDGTGHSHMGNVVHALHKTNVGKVPNEAGDLRQLLDVGEVHVPSLSRFDQFKERASYFMSGMQQAEYVASKFTYRVVLPNLDSTDARPTLLRWIRPNLVNVFSGKIDTCVKVAEDLAEAIE